MLLGVHESRAHLAVEALSRHVDRLVEIGRPVLAVGGDDGEVAVITSDGATWTVFPGRVERLLAVGGDLAELTVWSHGREVDRMIGEPQC